MVNIGIISLYKITVAKYVWFISGVDHFDILGFLHLYVELRGWSLLLLEFWVYPWLLDNRKLWPYVLLNYLFVLSFKLNHSLNSNMPRKFGFKGWSFVTRSNKLAKFVKSVHHVKILFIYPRLLKFLTKFLSLWFAGMVFLRERREKTCSIRNLFAWVLLTCDVVIVKVVLNRRILFRAMNRI